MKAVRVLLHNANAVQRNVFEKAGDYGQALEDFYSVKPRAIKIHHLPGRVSVTFLCLVNLF